MILAIADTVAPQVGRRNYAALEDGAEHTLTPQDVLDAGGSWYDSDAEAVAAMRAAGGGWTFDGEMCSFWHAAKRPDALPPVTEHSALILIPALQILRPELVRFAGAAHRDQLALEVCREYQRDPTASEADLRARARATVYGGGR